MESKVGILDFYVGRSIFITGATGFMGKVLVEKLLRSCPGIDRLYLLIRPKTDKDIRFRLQEMIKCKVFEWLRQNQPAVLKKLIPISGDVTLPNLGISLCDMQELELLNEVSVVFHLAICVKPVDDVRCAIESNVKGTKQVAVFSRQMKDLKAFVHVSTTYNNVEKDRIEEEVYPTSLDPQKLLDLVDCMDDKLLASITNQLVGKYPNVASYTHALSEQLLQKMSECSEPRFPAVIVRLSTITAALQEPLPGWVDNFNGPNGIVAGISKGLIQIARINAQLIADMIPVDLPVNLLIAAAWDEGICAESTSSIRVYNCSSGSINPIRWREWKCLAIRAADKFPCEEIIRCPSVALRANNRLLFQIEFVLFHLLPAFLIDIVAMVNGIEPFLTRLCKKTHKMMSRLEFYTLREWNFVSRNPAHLMDKMSPQEKNTFNFDVRQINWEKYMDAYVFGVRTHLFRDDLGTMSEAKNHLKQMKKMETLTRLRFIGVIFFFVYLFLSNFVSTPNSNITPDICSVINPSNFSITVQNFTAEIFSYTNRTLFFKSF